MNRISAPLGRLILLMACATCFDSHVASGRVFQTRLVVGDRLSASTNDVLLSPNGRFAVGFFPDAHNRFYFGCWFTDEISNRNISKVIWIADLRPTGSSASHAEWDGGNLFTFFTAEGNSSDSVTWQVQKSTKAELLNNGSFVFYDETAHDPTAPVFESFGMPLDTLLPGQVFRPNQVLTSLNSTAEVDPTPGPYSLKYQQDGTLGLWAQNRNYWLSETPDARTNADYGMFNIRGPSNKSLGVDSRLTLDSDGNLRLYAQNRGGMWTPVWAAVWPGCIPDRSLVVAVDCRNGVPVDQLGPRIRSMADTPAGKQGSAQSNSRLLIIIVSSASICGTTVVVAILFLFWYLIRRRGWWRRPPSDSQSSSKALNYRVDSLDSTEVVVTNGVGGMIKPQSFTFEEIQAATRNFRKLLGCGSFGKVYKGKLPDNRLIAVKKLEKSQQGQQQFQTEVLTVGSVFHPNLVRLYGFCSDEQHQMLVYEFVANRSLERYLFSEDEWKHEHHLDWPTRRSIAIGTAKGLRQCHEEQGGRPRIIHCDVKPENILLDENFGAKVSDFGLAKLMGIDKSWTRTHLRGTRGYLAPEWISGRVVTVKVDVYSFGIVLLEIITGSRCCDKRRTDTDFLLWVYNEVRVGNVTHVVDKHLTDYDEKQILRAIRCGLWCVQVKEQIRPSMHTVVEMLEGTQDVPIPPPPRPPVDQAPDHEVASASRPAPVLH